MPDLAVNDWSAVAKTAWGLAGPGNLSTRDTQTGEAQAHTQTHRAAAAESLRPAARDRDVTDRSLRLRWKLLLCTGGVQDLGPCEHWRGRAAPAPCAILGPGRESCCATPAKHYERVLLLGGHPDQRCRWWTVQVRPADWEALSRRQKTAVV